MRSHELDLNTIAQIGLIRHHTSYYAKIIKHITLNIQVIARLYETLTGKHMYNLILFTQEVASNKQS
jgi:hypothetical protein